MPLNKELFTQMLHRVKFTAVKLYLFCIETSFYIIRLILHNSSVSADSQVMKQVDVALQISEILK